MIRSPRFAPLILLGAVLTNFCGVTGRAGQDTPEPEDFSRCMAVTNDTARLRCFESLVGKPAPSPPTMGGWRLVRAAYPRGGADAVSIIHTADVTRSDPDLAGLMVRCAERGVEALVVVIEPLPPRARPRVTFGLSGREQNYMATVVPPFTAILLPTEAMAQLASAAGEGRDLSIEIESEGATIHGAVALTGLRRALDGLKVDCPRR
jgi:hypothetical protein